MAIAQYFTQSVLWSQAYGCETTGESKYSSPVDLACRIEHKISVVTNNLGQQVTSTSRLFVDHSCCIKPDDRVTLNCRCYTVLTTEDCFGFAASHKQVYLG